MPKSSAKIFRDRIPQVLMGAPTFCEKTYDKFFPSISLSNYLRPGTVSLLRGDGDLEALALYLAASTKFVGRIVYFRNSILCNHDRILNLLSQLHPSHPFPPVGYQYSADIQNFPSDPLLGSPLFSWQISFGIPFYNIKKITPGASLIFASGFDFSLMSHKQRKLVNDLRKQGNSVVLICREGLPGWPSSCFDNIFTCMARDHKPFSRNLSVSIHPRNNMSIMKTHLIAPDDRIYWIEKMEKYAMFKPLIEECIKQGMTAKEIAVCVQNFFSRKLSLATLAQLKRKWGIRKYRKEKHPRKKRQIATSSEEM